MCTVPEQHTWDIPFSEKNFSLFTAHFSLKHSHLMRGEVHKSSRKAAFTLAEVLVTLGIIGVVSAMTVPTLVQNYQRKSFVTQLHKVCSEVSQAAERYMSDNNYVSLKESRLLNSTDEMQKFVKKYFKVVKDCGERSYDSNGNKCFAKEYYAIDGGTEHANMAQGLCMQVVTIASGAALCFDSGDIENVEAGEDINGDGVVDEKDQANSANGFKEKDRNAVAMTVEVDINGPQGPNIAGRDFFHFDVRSDGMVYDSTWTKGSTVPTDKPWPMPIGKIIEDGWEMNY